MLILMKYGKECVTELIKHQCKIEAVLLPPLLFYNNISGEGAPPQNI